MLSFILILSWIAAKEILAAQKPLAFWRMNSLTGLTDSGNNSLHGMWMSHSRPISYTQGPDSSDPYGAVVLGPGLDDYVSFNYSQLQLNGSKSFTIALFFKSLGNSGPIFEYENTSSDWGWHMWANFPSDSIFVRDIDHFVCYHSFGWQFIALKYNAAQKTASLFCQDQWIESKFVPAFNPNTLSNTLNLGKRSGLAVATGRVACMSFYMVALGAQELCDLKWKTCLGRANRWSVADNCRGNLIGYWPLAAWSQLNDLSGHLSTGVSGNKSNSLAYVKGPNGDDGGAVEIGPGLNDFVYFNHSALDVMNSSAFMSVSFFFNANGIKTPSAMIEYFHGFHIWANLPDSKSIYVNPVYPDTYSVNASCKFYKGWQFVALTFNRTVQTMSIFCDDTWAVESVANETGLETSSGYFTLGKRFNSTVNKQQFACLSISSDVLSWSQLCEIKWRTCLKKSRLYSDDGCRAIVIGWWPFSSSYGIADISGYGFDVAYASPNQTPAYTMGPDGKFNSAALLGPGDKNYFTISNQEWYRFTGNDSWTFMFYLKVLDLHEGPILEYAEHGFSIWANRPARDQLWVSTGKGDSGQAFNCSLKCWQFAAIHYEAKTRSIFVVCGETTVGVVNLPVNVYPQTENGTFYIGKGQNQTSAICSLVLLKGSLDDKYLLRYWKPKCISRAAIDTDCLLTTTTTAAITTTTTATVLTTTMMATTEKLTNQTRSSTSTAIPPLDNSGDNIIANPVEALKSFYPQTISSERSSPLLTVEKLLKYCSDFSSTRIAPPNNNQPTSILTTFAVNRVVDFSDVQETISLDALLFLRWQVTTCPKHFLLKWLNEGSGGLERLFVPSFDDIWLPRYYFQTSAEDIFMKGRSFGDDLLATVAPNLDDDEMLNQTLTFFFLRRGFFKVKCPLNLGQFPFDSVTCKFTFALERSIDQIFFEQQYVFCPASVELTEWRFVRCDVLPTSWMRIDASNVSVATFTATFKRNPSYYVVNLALPNFAFGLLELSSYFIPYNRPERPIFAVATLLSLAVGQTTLTREIPHSSEQSILGNYTTSLSWISAAITIYHLLACCFSSAEDLKMPAVNMSKKATKLDALTFLFALFCFISFHCYIAVIVCEI